MGSLFIKVVKQAAPSDQGIDFKVRSEPGDVPKQGRAVASISKA